MAGLDLSIQGGQQFQAIAKTLRQVADKDLSREFYSAMQSGARPAIESVRLQFLFRLPAGGGGGKRSYRSRKTGQTLTNAVSGKTHAIKTRKAGALKKSESLAQRAAGANIRVVGKSGGANPRVEIVAKAGRKRIDLKAINEGNVRHPTFGHRDRWVSQSVPAGTFDQGVENKLDEVQKAILAALDNITAKLTAGS